MQVPLHPMIVHVPMALALLVPILALSTHVCVQRAWASARAWLVVVAAQAVLVASAVLAMRSGEADEERVERIVAESLLEQHEAAGKLFLLAAGIVLALAVVAALLPRASWARAWRLLTCAATLAVLWFGYRVGKLGGELVYVHGAAAAHTATPLPPRPGVERHQDGERDR